MKLFTPIFYCSYDNSTGIFIVPSGGDGLYYFSTYVLVDYGKYGAFNIAVNDDVICTAFGDDSGSGAEYSYAGCSAMAKVAEGDHLSLFLITE